METEEFWRLVDDTRAEARGDAAAQAEALVERLSALPQADVISFDATLRTLVAKAYSWDLWGAGFVAAGGLSDDCFLDFRTWLVSRGRSTYDAVVAQPDALADVEGLDDPAEQFADAEPIGYAADEAYERITGDTLPEGDDEDDIVDAGEDADQPTAPGPTGAPWDEDDEDALAERYPRCWARWGDGEADDSEHDEGGEG